MKVNVYSQIKSGAWGGGNQFLKALRKSLMVAGNYSDVPSEADVIIFNGYQDVPAILDLFKKSPKMISVYRLGPLLFLHRGRYWKLIDKILLKTVKFLADVVVFQSEWALNEAKKMGFDVTGKIFSVINNTVDKDIFFASDKTGLHSPIRLIYTSWSPNFNKGFDYLKFLDDNLDFGRFTMEFVGKTPLKFKNIHVHEAMGSVSLAEKLRSADIFISPVKDDACSNAILEALASGLPVIALDSGGNREICHNGGEYFRDKQELIQSLEQVVKNYNHYRSLVRVQTIDEVRDKYLEIIRKGLEGGPKRRVNRFRLSALKLSHWARTRIVKIIEKTGFLFDHS